MAEKQQSEVHELQRETEGNLWSQPDIGFQWVRGDLDYVANPAIIFECYNYEWGDLKRRVIDILSKARKASGAPVSLYARSRNFTEAELLGALAGLANAYPEVPVLLHCFGLDGLREIQRVSKAKVLVNYVSGERWALHGILDVLANRPLPVVVQTIGDEGIPRDVAGRMKVVEGVWRELEAIGLSRSEVYVDALSPSLCALPETLKVSLSTVEAAKREGFRTILWPANAGLGHPHRQVVGSAFVSLAMRQGLDVAVVRASDHELVVCMDTILKLRGDSQ